MGQNPLPLLADFFRYIPSFPSLSCLTCRSMRGVWLPSLRRMTTMSLNFPAWVSENFTLRMCFCLRNFFFLRVALLKILFTSLFLSILHVLQTRKKSVVTQVDGFYFFSMFDAKLFSDHKRVFYLTDWRLKWKRLLRILTKGDSRLFVFHFSL